MLDRLGGELLECWSGVHYVDLGVGKDIQEKGVLITFIFLEY